MKWNDHILFSTKISLSLEPRIVTWRNHCPFPPTPGPALLFQALVEYYYCRLLADSLIQAFWGLSRLKKALLVWLVWWLTGYIHWHTHPLRCPSTSLHTTLNIHPSRLSDIVASWMAWLVHRRYLGMVSCAWVSKWMHAVNYVCYLRAGQWYGHRICYYTKEKILEKGWEHEKTERYIFVYLCISLRKEWANHI